MPDYNVDSSALVELNFEVVQSFIEKLREPQFLLKGCNIFIELEPRDSAYVSALNSITSGKLQAKGIAEAVQSLLLSWNEVYYRDRPWLIERIVPDMQEFVRINEHEIDILKRTKLGAIADSNAQIVTKLFTGLAAINSFGKTGATKALNLLVPEVFVMWDTRIREAYHDFYHVHNKEEHRNGDASCYASFMRTHNEIAGELLPAEEDLKHQHPVFTKLGVRRSIAKMLDEANYARFTKSQIW